MIDVTFYGVRGSTPCSCDATRGVGGNTSCVLVRVAGEDPIILDCGTGLRYLGQDLLADTQPGEAFHGTALVTHLHWDHVQGLPFFVPILREGSELRLVGPVQVGRTLEEEVQSFVRPPLFPVALDVLPGTIDFQEMGSGSFEVGSATVTVCPVPHVGNTNGYRIETASGSLAYLSDHQQPSLDSTEVSDEVLQLCADVDVLIHDAQYDDEEFVTKANWGHSTARYAIEVAKQSGARRLVLFHHDPSHDDRWVEQVAAGAQTLAGDGIEVLAAVEGLSMRCGRTTEG